MKNKILAKARLGMAIVGIFATGMAHASGNAYTTSKGAVFTQVQGPGNFGEAWKDPSGTIWSTYQGDFANNPIKHDQWNVVGDSPATEACAKIGGALPTSQDYNKLASYFDFDSYNYLSDQGRKDMFAIFPDMDTSSHTDWFWTSSVVSSLEPPPYPTAFDSPDAFAFSGFFGNVTTFPEDMGNDRSLHLGVRCVSR